MAILIIGKASDGVDNKVRHYETLDDIEDFLHTKFSYQKYIPPGTDSLTLPIPGLNVPDDKLDGYSDVLLQKSLQTDRQTLDFIWIGGDQVEPLLELSYTPYYSGDDLAVALKRSINLGIKTYGVRLGGAHASATIGGFTFSARCSGAKYNLAKVTVNGSNVTFHGMEPDYPDTVVAYTNSASFIKTTNELADIGVIHSYCTVTPSSLSNATGTLSGGTDGTFNSASLTSCFDEITLPPDVETVLILGELASSALVTVEEFSLVNPSLTFFLNIGVPSSNVTTWATSFYTTSPKSDSLFYFASSLLATEEGNIERTIAEAAALSFLSQNKQIALSNLPLKNSDLTREFTSSELDVLYQAGICGPSRRIYSGPCLYKTVNGGGEEAIKRLAASRIAQIVVPILYQYIGNPLPSGRNLVIESTLSSALLTRLPDDITYLSSSVVVKAEVMEVEIKVTVYDEILELSFGVNY